MEKSWQGKFYQNSSIHGIEINKLRTVIAQFADNTQFYLKTKESVEQVIRMLDDVENSIGLKVNYEKSSIHTIAQAEVFECTKPLVWDPGGLCVLGIEINEEPVKNYKKLLDKAKRVLTP